LTYCFSFGSPFADKKRDLLNIQIRFFSVKKKENSAKLTFDIDFRIALVKKEV